MLCASSPVEPGALAAGLDALRFAGLDPSRKWLGKVKAEKLVNGIVGASHRGEISGTDAEQIASGAAWPLVELMAKEP